MTKQKAFKRNVSLKFGHLGEITNLHFELFPDASLGNMEENLLTKSMMGYFVCLANDESRMSPLNWKSKALDKVAPDIKSAETLSLEQALDDTVHLGNMISELYFNDPSFYQIPIRVNEDSKSLVESIFSTKKVKRKTMRIVISKIQESINEGHICDVRHVSSKDQLGDVMTKRGASSDKLISALENGRLEINPSNTRGGGKIPEEKIC